MSVNNSTQEKLDANDIYAWGAKRKKGFTTGQLADHFRIPRKRAAAFIAICRIRGQFKPNGRGSDGTSQWLP